MEPVEAAIEADAVDAAVRHSFLAVRGPLFGVAAQSKDDGPRWRVVNEITHGCPQQARDGLKTLLWFRAKDDAKNPAERRALLAAVARLETEYVDELTVLDTRYRVVRAEEYAAVDAHGGIEMPRPTDPNPSLRTGAPAPAIGRGSTTTSSWTPTPRSPRSKRRSACPCVPWPIPVPGSPTPYGMTPREPWRLTPTCCSCRRRS
ncbi:hypothetical protein SALBM135S_08135 [Streptomyces alboniger]